MTSESSLIVSCCRCPLSRWHISYCLLFFIRDSLPGRFTILKLRPASEYTLKKKKKPMLPAHGYDIILSQLSCLVYLLPVDVVTVITMSVWIDVHFKWRFKNVFCVCFAESSLLRRAMRSTSSDRSTATGMKESTEDASGYSLFLTSRCVYRYNKHSIIKYSHIFSGV